MNKHIRSWLAGTTMLVMTATGAFAEVVLNRGNSADPESLDPHKTSTVYEANILRDLFTGLAAQNAKAEVIPGAAESWTVSADGKTYTFKLRADGKWSDGSPVTAHDFVFAWQRLVDPGDRRRIRLHAGTGGECRRHHRRQEEARGTRRQGRR